MAMHGQLRQQPRVVAGLAGAILGAPIGLANAAIVGYAPAWGFAGLAGVAAALAGLLLGPTIIRAQRYGWLAVAEATYAFGVLLFPIASFLAGGLSPGPTLISSHDVSEILIAYVFTPIGFWLAVPFVPGVLIGGVLMELAAERLAPLPPVGDAEQGSLTRAAGLTAGCLTVLTVLGLLFAIYLGSQIGV